jgi:hypothetical protein
MKDIAVRFGLVLSFGSNSRQDRRLMPRSVIVAFLESVFQGVNWSQHKHGSVCLCDMTACVCVCLWVMTACDCVCMCVMYVCHVCVSCMCVMTVCVCGS